MVQVELLELMVEAAAAAVAEAAVELDLLLEAEADLLVTVVPDRLAL
jgi:hypothetical protein